MSVINIFDTDVFAGIIEGTGEGTLDVQFLFNENSGLATQSVHSARVGKNDPFCLSLPEQFDSEKDIILSFTETSTGRIIYECEKELGGSYYHDLGVITFAPPLQIAFSQPARQSEMHESLYPACGVFIILIAVTVFVMSPTAIQSIISRMRARRTPTHRRTVNSSRPAALPRTTPVTNNGMPPRNSNNSVSSLSSLGNDTSSESASVTTQRTGYNEPQQGIAGLQYYYASQQRRRNRPTLPVQNPYTADEELDGGNTLKSAGLASFNSKIFCDGDMYD